MEGLLKLPAATSINETKKLRDIYDKLESHVRSLQNIGINSETYGSFLSPVIMSKIPEELRIAITRDLSTEEWDLEPMLEIFRKELQIREKCQFIPGHVSTREPRTNYLPKRHATFEPSSTTSALFTDGIPQAQRSSWCTYCKGPHPSSNCTVMTNVAARKQFIRQKGKCFICLRSGHVARRCVNGKSCHLCGQKGHHPSLCESLGISNRSVQQWKASGEESRETPNLPAHTSTTNMFIGAKNSVLLQTARANIYKPDDNETPVNARLIFDSCSQRSYVTESLQRFLNLPVLGRDTLLIKTFGEPIAKLRECDIVQLAVESKDGMKIYVSAYVVPLICTPVSNQMVEFTQTHYQHLQSLELADSTQGTDELSIDLLIGADFYWQFVTGITVRGQEPGPVALSTRLGYVLSGPVGISPSSPENSIVNFTETHVLEICTSVYDEKIALDQQVRRFWDLETLGIKQEEPTVYEKFIANIKHNGDRYEVKLPFKEFHPILPDNYQLSKRRMETLLRRLSSEPQILKHYDEVIKDQLRNGIVEIVTQGKELGAGKVHYLPHREVIRMDKQTTKIRVVYDASAKRNGPSLNDCLYAGPPLTPLIFEVLIRFRAHAVALTADIEKAFLNVAIAPEHRDYLRFLWIDDVLKDDPQLLVMRFARVVFGVSSSPFLLNATIRFHLDTYRSEDPDFVDDVLRSLYVDDLANSKPDQASAYEFYTKLKSRFKEGGFNMRKWLTNDPILSATINSQEDHVKGQPLAELQQEDQTFTKSQFHSQCTEDLPRVLGTAWNTTTDQLVFTFESLTSYLEEEVITKRVILSSIAKIFDPLGILSPVFTALKILFQEICKQTVDWDSPLGDEVSTRWKSLLKDMRETSRISINRCYLSPLPGSQKNTIDIHGFGDASDKAYGAVVYLRILSGSSVWCSIVASKTRVTPITGSTTPTTKLLSALVLAKLIASVRKALEPTLKINKTVCWLDSEIALWWIYGIGKEFKPFIQNRVLQIRELVPLEAWRHVPSGQNPADVASRGCKASQLKAEQNWWEGPAFLKKEEEFWPEQKNFGLLNFEFSDIAEIKKIKKVTTYLVEDSAEGLGNVIRPEDHSDLLKLLRVTSHILRFIRRTQKKEVQPRESVSEVGLEEIKEAEEMWIKHVQKFVRTEGKYDQMRVSMGLFEDEKGILRCGGRLHNAPLSYDARFPIILPQKHPITELVIRRYHNRVMHNGVKDTLTDVRSRFWIVKGRRAVRDVLSRCVTCKKLEGLAYSAPPQPPLPDFRVSDDFAFSRVGVDFAGPVFVKDVYSRSKRCNKAYIAIFTCASSRAVHLELVPDLSTPSFLKSFKRLIARRGVPHLVISDNGKTFKSKVLKSFLIQHGINWRFNIPRAPWWGGFFERMVRSVKRCLKKTLGNARVNYEEFETTLIEVEAVLNSRPLTYLTESVEEPLTPSSLCLGRRLLSHPPNTQGSITEDCNNPAAELSRRQKYLSTVLQHFWDRWRKEYLTELREHHRCKTSPQARIIKQGDVVCVFEDSTPRQRWKIGVVEDLIYGRDQNVRAAVVRMASRGGEVRLKRPVQRLYPVEVPNDTSRDVVHSSGGSTSNAQEFAVQFVPDEEVQQIRNS